MNRVSQQKHPEPGLKNKNINNLKVVTLRRLNLGKFMSVLCFECGVKLEFLSDKFTNNFVVTELFEKFRCPKCGCEYEFDTKITRVH